MQIIRIWALFLLMTLSVGAAAQNVTSKGVGNETLQGAFTSEIKSAALREAAINALDRYFSKTNQAKARNYELVRDELIQAIDQYVLSVTILSEDIDGVPIDEASSATEGIYSVVVRADINANRLNNELKSRSVVASTATADKSLLTFVFVARQQSSVQKYDDKVYKRTDVNAEIKTDVTERNDIKESENIQANSISLQDSRNASATANVDASVAVTTGGSTTTKANVVKWEITRSANINSVMSGIFTNAGYEVIEAEYLEEESGGLVNLQAIRDDYQTGDDLSSETKRNFAKGVRSVDIPYLALGTLDVGMQSIDPVSGLVRVYVTVSGKVLDVSGRFPKTASSVGPVQIAGLGPDETVARTNALKLAAETAAHQLTDELNAKGFQ